MIVMNCLAFHMTLSMGLKGVVSMCYRICVAPKLYMVGWGEKEAEGEGSREESQKDEEGGETGRAEHQADRRCQPITGALRSCRDRAWEPRAGGARSPSLGSPRTVSSCAQSSEKVPSLLLII